jgi:hypothetical protein
VFRHVLVEPGARVFGLASNFFAEGADFGELFFREQAAALFEHLHGAHVVPRGEFAFPQDAIFFRAGALEGTLVGEAWHGSILSLRLSVTRGMKAVSRPRSSRVMKHLQLIHRAVTAAPIS